MRSERRVQRLFLTSNPRLYFQDVAHEPAQTPRTGHFERTTVHVLFAVDRLEHLGSQCGDVGGLLD
jgi:hypothetical protein